MRRYALSSRGNLEALGDMFYLFFDFLVVHVIFSINLVLPLLVVKHYFVSQMKKRKLKEQEKRKQYEKQKAKDEQLAKKRKREERRERYREEDKQKKRARKKLDV